MIGDVWRTFLWKVIPHLEPSWLLLRDNVFPGPVLPNTSLGNHGDDEFFCSLLMFKQDNQSDGRRLFCAKLRTDAELLGSWFCLYFDCKCLLLDLKCISKLKAVQQNPLQRVKDAYLTSIRSGSLDFWNLSHSMAGWWGHLPVVKGSAFFSTHSVSNRQPGFCVKGKKSVLASYSLCTRAMALDFGSMIVPPP